MNNVTVYWLFRRKGRKKHCYYSILLKGFQLICYKTKFNALKKTGRQNEEMV